MECAGAMRSVIMPWAMQVYIDTFADGPTRVVRFSDKVADSFDTSTGELIRQTHLLQRRLHATDLRFAALRGGATMERLDIFGQAEQHLQRFQTEPRNTATAAQPRLPRIQSMTLHQPLGGHNEVVPWQQQLGLLDPTQEGSPQTAAAVSMMLAGDLKVTILDVRGHLMEGAANTMVRLMVDGQVQQSSVQWGTNKPVWDEAFTFYAVCTSFVLPKICSIHAASFVYVLSSFGAACNVPESLFTFFVHDVVFDNAIGRLTDYKSYRLEGLICPDNMLLR
jgi:hypothetical protein